jgi:hypothetical protein
MLIVIIRIVPKLPYKVEEPGKNSAKLGKPPTVKGISIIYNRIHENYMKTIDVSKRA